MTTTSTLDPTTTNRWEEDHANNSQPASVSFDPTTTTATTTPSKEPSPHAAAAEDGDSSLHHPRVCAKAAAHIPTATASARKQARERVSGRWLLFLPWTKSYRIWWAITLVASIFTVFLETYLIAFVPAGLNPYNDAASILSYILYSIFMIDIFVNFNLAFYNESDEIVCNRREIARNYVVKGRMFWIDFIGVCPFYAIALACAGELGQDSTLARYLSLLRLLKLVRLYRVGQLFEILQYSTKVSLMSLTLIRNFGLALVWTHTNACIMFFISSLSGHDENDTWIGGSYADLNAFERYVTALYWSVVTFTTVGYGDYSPVNSAEQIWGMIYMMLNIIMQAWIIGSITLLIVKNDEKTGEYRDTLQILQQYSDLHGFSKSLHKRLRAQIKLDFGHSEICDEVVLSKFPSSLRRRVLRRLYLPSLLQTSLMQEVRQQFVDAFLATCKVELFSPGEEILQRGSISSDLYLLVGGTVELSVTDHASRSGNGSSSNNGSKSDTTKHTFGSIPDSDMASAHGAHTPPKLLHDGDFINEVGFFTESPQSDNVRTLTVCKTLTMSRSAYKTIAEDHPGSAGKILHNLLAKVEAIAEELGTAPTMSLPKPLAALNAGSAYYPRSASGSNLNSSIKNEDDFDPSSSNYDLKNTVAAVQTKEALTAIQDLIKMHISKQKDDHTTRFLFAASRGDMATIDLMCEQGFDPNSADYDSRTALMVAAMKGNTEVVTRLLEFHADHSLVDMHGSSALYEASRNGHEDTMEVLVQHGATLCMDECLAASTLCQAVSNGDVLTLQRLLRAKIQVNAADYDKRTAAHIASAEGNVAALKVLVEFGADINARDRWGNTIQDEAKRSNAGQLLEYLKTFEEKKEADENAVEKP